MGIRSRVKRQLKLQLKKRFWLCVIYHVITDFWAGVKYSFGNIFTDSGTLHSALNTNESVDYILSVYQDYLRYGGVPEFAGRIAEVGPGDNCGVGLLFLANGCQSVDLVDRFFSRKDAGQQAKIYETLAEQIPPVGDILSGNSLLNDQEFPGICRFYGPSAAAETFFREREVYDVIVSRAVLEHVQDPLVALEAMSWALKPGGKMLHKVDLRDHGMFSDHHHELKFLEIPDRIYPWLVRRTGRPNRVLIGDYRERLNSLPLEFELLVTRMVGVGEIEPHIPYSSLPSIQRDQAEKFVDGVWAGLSRRIQRMKKEDVAISGFFLVATRKVL